MSSDDAAALHTKDPLTPWDIGGPQPAIQQLVAYGALRGEVLDPGTGPGHHAIYYASKGYPTTAIDLDPATIELAKHNARRARVEVDFQLADAVELVGFDDRFDTVVDSAFYHGFQDDEELQLRYARNLHRATRPEARLFMFETGRHNVNGWRLDGSTAESLRAVLTAAGWHLDYLGTTTYQGIFDPGSFAEMIRMMEAIDRPDIADGIKVLHSRFRTLEPLLEGNLIHMPFWSVVATRVD